MANRPTVSSRRDWGASIPGVLDIAIEGVAGANQGEPIYFDNVGHPAATRLALAKASHSHMHAFGIDWDDTSGRRPFCAVRLELQLDGRRCPSGVSPAP